MADVTIKAYATVVTDDPSERPLLTPEALRPSWEHQARKLGRESGLTDREISAAAVVVLAPVPQVSRP